MGIVCWAVGHRWDIDTLSLVLQPINIVDQLQDTPVDTDLVQKCFISCARCAEFCTWTATTRIKINITCSKLPKETKDG
jgi:hypothetical protein